MYRLLERSAILELYRCYKRILVRYQARSPKEDIKGSALYGRGSFLNYYLWIQKRKRGERHPMQGFCRYPGNLYIKLAIR
jgi:hypothetical protein